MAALLRSARLLKLSPASLLHTNRVNISGSPLSRLCSGTIGGRGVAIRRLRAPVSPDVYRLTWPSAGVRHFALAPEQQGSAKDEGSPAVRSNQAQQFDWALGKLDSSVRRTGRVTKSLLLRIFQDICRTGYPSGNQALLLLRSCGSLLPEVPLSERTELAHQIWDKLQELGASYDASHFNALLKVYLQNEFKFSPTDFLAKMEAANLQPNRVTYQRLIAAYCQEGDIEGASKILGFMKNKELPITEAVFNSLVTGHARAGDMASAENILPLMKGAGIEPGPDTYLALLIAFAEKGDMDRIKQILEELTKADIHLMDRDLMQVIFSLAKAGHHQHVPEMVERMRHERGYVPEAMNLCLSLITQGEEDTAFSILKTFPIFQAEGQNSESPDLGNFFLRHCVNMDKPIEKLRHYCKELLDLNLHASPLQFSLFCALEAKKTGIAVQLMKIMKEEGLPVRPHYFWPLLVQHQKDKNVQGTLEVLRGMQTLDVLPDVETYSSYVLPSFSSLDSARSALKEAGCAVDTEGFTASEVRAEAMAGNLSRLFSLLSSPTFPAVDMTVFRGSLIHGFKKSDDVESLAKITELLYRDSRFCQGNTKPSEAVSYFLYNLMDGMSEAELQAREEKLRQYFHQLKRMKITIPVNIYRGIRNLLDASHVPELIKDVIILVDGKDKVGTLDLPKGLEGKVSVLEKKLEELKGENQALGPTLKQLILALCAEENLDRALELKTQYETEMVVGSYAALINLCCHHDNVEEALNLKREVDRKDSSVVLTANKYLALVKVLSKHDKLEEAVDVLKEMKEKGVAVKDNAVPVLFHVLNGAAMRGDGVTVKRLQDAIFSLGLAKPTANLCSPLVTVHLERGDLSGALEAALDCHKQYGQLPRIHDVLCRLVEKGETELLQKAMDFVSQERGEMTMLYDLFFAFMQTGKYREARKIIETPGLRARPGRLQWYAEKCISGSQMEPLENMVEMTEKLFECDRDEMYHYVLRLCKDLNDWRKAEAAWTKMQEENVIPRERTLRLLADILKSNAQEVPFEVPEVWYEEAAGEKPQKAQLGEPKGKGAGAARSPAPTEKGPDFQPGLVALCKKGKAKEAYALLKDTEKDGPVLGTATYDSVIRVLLAKGCMEEALEIRDIASSRIQGFNLSDVANSLLVITQTKRDQVKDALATLKAMLKANQIPSQLAVTRVVQAFGNLGDAQAVQEVEDMVKGMDSSLTLSRMLFVNNIAVAHIRNGDLEAAVEGLEALYTPGSEMHSESVQATSMSFVFRKVLEEKNEDALDKLSAMAERLANQFASYRPVTNLFLQYVDLERLDEARFLLQRCAAICEQKELLISYVTRTAQKPGQVQKIKSLLELIPDALEKSVVYPYLMKCYGQDNDLSSAKALHKQMQEEGVEADELCLKRLAVLYKNAGEDVPFQEPPESFKFYADKLIQKTKDQRSAEEK